MLRSKFGFAILFLFAMTAASPCDGQVMRVGASQSITSLALAVETAKPGQEIILEAGVYNEPPIAIDKSLTITGEEGAILDGSGKHQILTIEADSVTVRGLVLRNVGVSFMEDRAAIKVDGGHYCVIEENEILDAFFGIYLAKSAGCIIRNNRIVGADERESRSGNGIHLWYSRDVRIEGNFVSRHRDGIYFEFVEDTIVIDNVSEKNRRYGLHFMFSDRCTYRKNLFRNNDAGVAVMYTKSVTMIGNRFEANWGSAAYGLLLKDITDSEIRGNHWVNNTIGIYAEGANRVLVEGNTFEDNGWALKVMANCIDTQFIGNNFFGNTFDVATNSTSTRSRFEANYWDQYEGYDLDRNGFGDVPFRPVRLFSLIVEKNEPALILQNSLLVRFLDTLERILPGLTPSGLVDASPLMRGVGK